MEELLRRLLNQLEQIGAKHEELYDTECRERMGNAVMEGFVRGKSDFILADDFGLYDAEGNQAVKAALAEYIANANERVVELRISGFHERLTAFQNEDVKSSGDGNFYDDFFGYSAPEQFDAEGDVIESCSVRPENQTMSHQIRQVVFKTLIFIAVLALLVCGVILFVRQRWGEAFLVTMFALMGIPLVEPEAPLRERLRTCLMMPFALGGLACFVVLYFQMFNFDWFRAVFNDKGTGEFGLILFACLGLVVGFYIGFRCVSLLFASPEKNESESIGQG